MKLLLVCWLRNLLPLALCLAAAQALAAAYTLPGTLPTGCTASAGTYTCTPLTLGNNDTLTLGAPLPATLNVNGNFNTGNRPFINTAGAASDLSINVTGSVSIGNQGQINGSLTATGALNLGNSTVVSSCVRSSSSATINLGNNASAGGVCCGAIGSCSSSCVVNNSGSPMPALCAAPPSPSTAGRFNSFDTGTAAGSVSGVIHTKIAGSLFSVAVVAVNTAGTGVATTFTGTVSVELLDSSNNSGALNSSTGCRSSWVVASGTSASTLTLAGSDQGRKNINFTVANAWRDVRVRVSSPATGTATVVGCSSDNFAIRPATFAGFSATDTDLQTAGTARLLNTVTLAGGSVHKAGQPFSLRATVSPATATNYTATPTAVISPCVGAACTATLGALTTGLSNTSGVIRTDTASYTEAGTFSLQLVDSTFASVDATDGSTATEINITSATLTVGRFVPDRFNIVTRIGSGTPTFRTFNSTCVQPRSFTYFGQPFGYVTPPEATVTALNAAGGPMLNYPNAKLAGLTRSQTYTPLPTATPGLQVRDSTGGTAILPTITPHGNGTATLATQASDVFTMLRPASAPLAPYFAAIGVTWSVADTSESGTTGNGTAISIVSGNYALANIAFDGQPPNANEFRFGVLKLGSAYGSELINLAVPVELQYWNGSSFATNAADQCTTLAASSLALGTYRGNLVACETAPGSASVVFTSGRGLLRMLPPGAGNAGSADVTVNLGAVAAGQQCTSVGAAASPAVTANMPWLQGVRPGVLTYNQDPAARISFGQYRSPLIHMREMY
jgi:MSHA biogenesis protein MshQ